MSKRRKVFISYHHEKDQAYRNEFERLFADGSDIMESRTVNIGDIDSKRNAEYIRQKIRNRYIADAEVIVVLIGKETWQREYVDWEIHSGLRDTSHNPRCGLLGILLKYHPAYEEIENDCHTIPARLYDNVGWKFAKLYDWTEDPVVMKKYIHEAYVKSKESNPINTRENVWPQ